MGTKPINDSARERLRACFKLRAVDDGDAQLAEMLNYPGPVAALVEALKREGVRFDERSFPHGNITHLNPYVAIIRGEAAEFLHCAHESIKGRSPAHQPAHGVGLLVNGLGCPPGRSDGRPDNSALEIVHKRSLPNVQI